MKLPSHRSKVAVTLAKLEKCVLVSLGFFLCTWFYACITRFTTEPKFGAKYRILEASRKSSTHFSVQDYVGVYEKIVTSSFDSASMKVLISRAGPSNVPCIPQQGVCDLAMDHRIRAFNSWHQPRYLCGQKINADSFHILTKNCNEGVRIFEEEPSLQGVTISPIRLLFNSNDEAHLSSTTFKCSVPCKCFGGGGNVQTVYVGGTDIIFQHSMESSVHYELLKIQPHAWQRNYFYATTSFKSEVPLPYFSWAEYSIQSSAVQYDAAIKGASFIARNCASMNGREAVVQELMKMIRVDALSECLHNANPPEGSDVEKKKTLMSKYLLHFAFENSNEDDYITEKLWGSFESGALPVYMGAPNVLDHVPEHSLISWHDFPSTNELGKYLQQVISNRTLYESYHEWRMKPISDRFNRKYNMTHVHSVCRTCKYVYSLSRGFGWNSEKQDMEHLKLPRKVCLNDNGAIIYPFVETVVDVFTSTPETLTVNSSCAPSATIPSASMIGNWHRTVWFHDGVIDITFEGMSTNIYRIVTPLGGILERLRTNVYQTQDSVSRMTIVGDPVLHMSISHERELNIRLSQKYHEPQRLRLIIEDIDMFHAGARSSQTYFGRSMVDEFEHPLQFVRVLSN